MGVKVQTVMGGKRCSLAALGCTRESFANNDGEPNHLVTRKARGIVLTAEISERLAQISLRMFGQCRLAVTIVVSLNHDVEQPSYSLCRRLVVTCKVHRLA